MFARFAAVVLILAVGWTIRIQVRDYLLMTPEQITSKLKGGAQWVALRTIARDLDRIVGRAGIDRSMYVWGWQSPLYFYGRFDSPTEYAFVDPLLKAKAASDHPLVRPRLREILADLDAKPPSLILAADPPFPALLQFLRDRYVISYAGFFPFLPDGRGLWIRRDALESFEAARGWPLPGR